MARPSCERCARPLAQCLCALIPSLANQVPVLLLQHSCETKHALNTARFVGLGLQQVEWWIGEHFEALAERLNRSQRPLLLFPGEQALSLTEAREQTPPDLLVVLDGTWRKARKMLYCNPVLESVPRIQLPADNVSRYRLRKADMPGALATVEAVVEVLSVWQPDAMQSLLKPFEALIEQQIAAMGDEVFRMNHINSSCC